MKRNSYLWLFIISLIFLASFITSCKKKEEQQVVDIKEYNINYYDDNNNLIKNIKIKENEKLEAFSFSKNHYNFLGWMDQNNNLINLDNINSDLNLYPKLEKIPFVSFSISGPKNVIDGNSVRLKIDYEDDSENVNVEWSISDDTICSFDQKNKSYCRLSSLKPGKVVISATYQDFKAEYNLEVLGATYSISYVCNDEDQTLLGTDYLKEYNTANFPIDLPTLAKDDFFFMGWKIQNYDGVYKQILASDDIREDIIISPVWVYPHLVLEVLDNKTVIGLDEEITLSTKLFDIPSDWGNEVEYSFTGSGALELVEGSLYKAKSLGYVEAKASLKLHPSINITIGITITKDKTELNELTRYLAEIASTPIVAKPITVVTWQMKWQQDLLSSVMPYLFEELDIVENIAPMGYSRPGTKKQKYYVCVHDTADYAFNAQKWSQTVYNKQYDDGTAYEASFQYVVGNDGIYHNIPDDEVSWHAGDGTKVSYSLSASGVFGTNPIPVQTISSDGYFELDGKKTVIKAPTNNGAILTTKDLGDLGVRCVLQEDGQYYLGPTYYNTSYRKISNYGGNNNSIGIESCVNSGSDVFYTWQKLAKLVAYLVDENNLEFTDITQHHFFSGKNCPQTMRESNMWDYFINMVKVEYNIRQYLKGGYQINLEVIDDEYINNVGRIIKWPMKTTTVRYKVKVTKNELNEELELGINIPGRALL